MSKREDEGERKEWKKERGIKREELEEERSRREDDARSCGVKGL